jgi:hypothetical protein
MKLLRMVIKKSEHTPKHLSFSLIELLIVITVLTILVTLLSPALKKGINSARLIACATHYKDIGTIYSQFLGDNDELILDYGNPILKNNPFWFRLRYDGWTDALTGYSDRVNQIIYCPEDDSDDAINQSSKWDANASYYLKKPLIDKYLKSPNHPKTPVHEMAFPFRQSLLVSRSNMHTLTEYYKKDHESPYSFHNVLYFDSHVTLNYEGFNNSAHKSNATSNTYFDYRVYANNQSVKGKDKYDFQLVMDPSE